MEPLELSSPAGMHSWLNPNARANHLSVAVVAPLATHALRVLVRSQHVVERSSRSTISTRITSTIILQGLGLLPGAERKRLLMIPESAKGYPCGVDCAIVAAL